MPLVGYSPWTDAAAYGAGLGSTLSQAMLQMPQQRLELAQQAHVQQQRQDIARQQLMQQQQEAQAQQSLGLGQLELHKQELQQNAEQHQLELARMQKQIELAQKGTWKVVELPDGTPALLNTTTGEHRQMDFGSLQSGGLGAVGKPATQGQVLDNFMKGTGLAGQFGATGAITNQPAQYQALTNVLSQLGSRLGGLGAAPQQQAPTNTFKVGNYIVQPLGQ